MRELRWSEFTELSSMFFVQALAMGSWFVPLGAVLDAHGYQSIKPVAFATSAIAAFVSPLIFAAMADRRAPPMRVLRWLAMATASAMALAALAIQREAQPAVVLACIQLHALCSAPGWGLSTAIVFARLHDAHRQFGPIRGLGTFGWMVGCWIVSALRADTSSLAGYLGALAWLAVAALTFFLPDRTPPRVAEKITLRERLGLDALVLMKNRDHRVVFLTAAFFSIPLAAFYPFTPAHLRALGVERTAAWMTLGQTTEMLAMFALYRVTRRWRLKWTLCAGLAFGVVRFALCAMNTKSWLLAGITAHGFSYTPFFITAQIYLDQRIDPAWRARAQALLALMISGVGNLFGYLGTGWWFRVCKNADAANWPMFWSGLSACAAFVLVYFALAYHGQPPAPVETPSGEME